MKVVIDSNRLRSEELRGFLKRSRSHKAVLIDYASIEAYKKDADKTIGRSMAILGEYATQVLVLRSTGTIYDLDPRIPDMTGRMVWREHTKTFGIFVKQLDGIETGAPTADMHIRYLGNEAKALLARRNEEAHAMPDLFKGMRDLFAPAHYKAYRDAGIPPDDALGIIIDIARMVANVRARDGFDTGLDHNDILNHFAIRHALGTVLQFFEWTRHGRPALIPKRWENDAADAIFTTYGTYFNGLMTGDVRAAALHGGLRSLLRRLGGSRPGRARMPAPYI